MRKLIAGVVLLALAGCSASEDAVLVHDAEVVAADVRVACKVGSVLMLIDPTAVGLAVDAAGEAVCAAAGAVPAPTVSK